MNIGIEYIFGQFKKVLEDEGVVQFGKVGDEFNPNLHESIEMVNVTKEDENGKLTNCLFLSHISGISKSNII